MAIALRRLEARKWWRSCPPPAAAAAAAAAGRDGPRRSLVPRQGSGPRPNCRV